ncbi:hypothetical protein BDI4_380029 [Burkholderia diffusa]|nr:hypothetical protein BDI4_380029 [Burkholderia diffusa]
MKLAGDDHVRVSVATNRCEAGHRARAGRWKRGYRSGTRQQNPEQRRDITQTGFEQKQYAPVVQRVLQNHVPHMDGSGSELPVRPAHDIVLAVAKKMKCDPLRRLLGTLSKNVEQGRALRCRSGGENTTGHHEALG